MKLAVGLLCVAACATHPAPGVLEIAEDTVRSGLSRARDKLREVLAKLAPPDEAALAESQLDTK